MDGLDPKIKLAYLMVLILLLALVGLVMIAGLRMAWRRFLARQQNINRPRHAGPSEPLTDVWRVSGQRLVGQEPRPGEADNRSGRDDEYDDQDDDPQDDDDSWRDDDEPQDRWL